MDTVFTVVASGVEAVRSLIENKPTWDPNNVASNVYSRKKGQSVDEEGINQQLDEGQQLSNTIIRPIPLPAGSLDARSTTFPFNSDNSTVSRVYSSGISSPVVHSTHKRSPLRTVETPSTPLEKALDWFGYRRKRPSSHGDESPPEDENEDYDSENKDRRKIARTPSTSINAGRDLSNVSYNSSFPEANSPRKYTPQLPQAATTMSSLSENFDFNVGLPTPRPALKKKTFSSRSTHESSVPSLWYNSSVESEKPVFEEEKTVSNTSKRMKIDSDVVSHTFSSNSENFGQNALSSVREQKPFVFTPKYSSVALRQSLQRRDNIMKSGTNTSGSSASSVIPSAHRDAGSDVNEIEDSDEPEYIFDPVSSKRKLLVSSIRKDGNHSPSATPLSALESFLHNGPDRSPSSSTTFSMGLSNTGSSTAGTQFSSFNLSKVLSTRVRMRKLKTREVIVPAVNITPQIASSELASSKTHPSSNPPTSSTKKVSFSTSNEVAFINGSDSQTSSDKPDDRKVAVAGNKSGAYSFAVEMPSSVVSEVKQTQEKAKEKGLEEVKSDLFSFSVPSDSGKSTTAPSFSFGGPEKSSVDKPVVEKEKEKEPSPSTSTPSFNFGSATSKEAPSFSFGGAVAPAPAPTPAPSTAASEPAKEAGSVTDKVDASKPLFSFGNTSTADASKPLFSFGSSAAADSTKKSDVPSFSFGSSSTAKDTAVPAPVEASKSSVFSFGSAPSSSADKPASAGVPSFSFGSTTSSAVDESKKGIATSGVPSKSVTPAESSTVTTSAPLFSFGSSSSTDASAPAAPAGNTVSSSSSDAVKKDSLFSFGSGNTSLASNFNFGASSSKNEEAGKSTSLFSFGSSTAADKPAGNTGGFSFSGFGATSSAPAAASSAPTSDSKPFAFGSSDLSKNSSFSFGASTAAASTPVVATSNTVTPSSGGIFSFGSANNSASNTPVNGTSSFSFGVPSHNSSTSSLPVFGSGNLSGSSNNLGSTSSFGNASNSGSFSFGNSSNPTNGANSAAPFSFGVPNAASSTSAPGSVSGSGGFGSSFGGSFSFGGGNSTGDMGGFAIGKTSSSSSSSGGGARKARKK